ncbi:hypothetical protein HOP38_07280 [Vibrio mediterranei]|uniref:hypothetical protein n=1 Tax=Vibrio mediterranei TaxID=689 RepID=UPI0017CD3768|nr:hypothetical protein [Vibrio mediterranei]NUW72314.1 hypothetical protein [Vibrio mediterranei]
MKVIATQRTSWTHLRQWHITLAFKLNGDNTEEETAAKTGLMVSEFSISSANPEPTTTISLMFQQSF